jgi:hypothetical protein
MPGAAFGGGPRPADGGRGRLRAARWLTPAQAGPAEPRPPKGKQLRVGGDDHGAPRAASSTALVPAGARLLVATRPRRQRDRGAHAEAGRWPQRHPRRRYRARERPDPVTRDRAVRSTRALPMRRLKIHAPPPRDFSPNPAASPDSDDANLPPDEARRTHPSAQQTNFESLRIDALFRASAYPHQAHCSQRLEGPRTRSARCFASPAGELLKFGPDGAEAFARQCRIWLAGRGGKWTSGRWWRWRVTRWRCLPSFGMRMW